MKTFWKCWKCNIWTRESQILSSNLNIQGEEVVIHLLDQLLENRLGWLCLVWCNSTRTRSARWSLNWSCRQPGSNIQYSASTQQCSAVLVVREVRSPCNSSLFCIVSCSYVMLHGAGCSQGVSAFFQCLKWSNSFKYNFSFLGAMTIGYFFFFKIAIFPFRIYISLTIFLMWQ